MLANVGPDEPFGGGEAPDDFDAADPETTGQVMQFRVVPATTVDTSTPPQFLQVPAITPAGGQVTHVALIEELSPFFEDAPAEALLGTVDGDPNVAPGVWTKRLWMDEVTENPAVGATEVWELYNATADAHPMHIHEVHFELVNRQDIVVDEAAETVQATGAPRGPEPWEKGFKDTIIAYPGQVTRVRLRFDTPGQFVWHCHIVEHEDNEMMRPYRIGSPASRRRPSPMAREPDPTRSAITPGARPSARSGGLDAWCPGWHQRTGPGEERTPGRARCAGARHRISDWGPQPPAGSWPRSGTVLGTVSGRASSLALPGSPSPSGSPCSALSVPASPAASGMCSAAGVWLARVSPVSPD